MHTMSHYIQTLYTLQTAHIHNTLYSTYTIHTVHYIQWYRHAHTHTCTQAHTPHTTHAHTIHTHAYADTRYYTLKLCDRLKWKTPPLSTSRRRSRCLSSTGNRKRISQYRRGVPGRDTHCTYVNRTNTQHVDWLAEMKSHRNDLQLILTEGDHRKGEKGREWQCSTHLIQ